MSSVGGGGARNGTNTGSMLFKLKPSGERDLNADQVIQELRPKLARVMGVNAFMQNPPAIRVGGMQSKSMYQYTLQDTNQDELQQNATKLLNALQHVPGFADVTSDMDFASPSVDVDIDRDQAASAWRLDLLHRNRAGRLLRRPADFHHLCQRRRILGDAGIAAAISERHQRYRPALYFLQHGRPARSTSSSAGIAPNGGTSSASTTSAGTVNSLVPLSAVTKLTPGTMPLAVNHLGQLPAITISFNLTIGLCAVRCGHRDQPDARQHRHAARPCWASSRARPRPSRVRWAIWACCSPSPSSRSISSWAFSMRASSIRSPSCRACRRRRWAR